MASFILCGRRVSDTVYTNFEIQTVSFTEIAEATKAFLNENFSGAVRISANYKEGGFVDVSADGFAYFFKVVLGSVFGREVIDIDLYSNEAQFKVTIEWNARSSIKDSERDTLLTVAKNSGFDFEFSQGDDKIRIVLNLKKSSLPFLSVYATDLNRMMLAFKRVFFL